MRACACGTGAASAPRQVNRLSETLQRSFAAADEVIYRDAIRSSSSKACYKVLAAMHEGFGRMVEHAQTIANRSSDATDLRDSVLQLSVHNVPEAMKRVEADLKEIKADNAGLAAAAK